MASQPEITQNPPLNLRAELIRFMERAFLIVLSVLVIVRIAPHVVEHPQLALFLFGELLGVVLMLVQRRGDWTMKPYPIILALAGTGAALCVIPSGQAFIPDTVSFAIISTGVLVAIAAKLFLGRSFGLIPANRGVKSAGIYRLVRHPMYLGYMIHHTGYLLVYFSAWNVAVYAVAWTALYLRTIEEEKFLMQDEAYREYAKAVRFRLVPGII